MGSEEAEVKIEEEKDRTYKQALLDEVNLDNSPPDQPSKVEFAFDYSSLFIIERFKIGIGESSIKENMQKKVDVGFALKLFCANLAMGICSRSREVKVIVDKGVVGEIEEYVVRWWSLKLIAKRKKIRIRTRMGHVSDIPPLLQTRQVIKSMVDQCGGLTEEDDIFKEICWIKEVCIKVVGNDSRFMSSVCYLYHEDVYFSVRLVAEKSTPTIAVVEEGNSKKSNRVLLGLPASLAGQRTQISRDHVKHEGKSALGQNNGSVVSGPKGGLMSEKWSSQSQPSKTQENPKGPSKRLKEKGSCIRTPSKL